MITKIKLRKSYLILIKLDLNLSLKNINFIEKKLSF